MKTLNELKDHGHQYLIGYAEALKDVVDMISDPKLYDRQYSRKFLNDIDDYVNYLMKEEREHISKMIEEERNEIGAAYR